MDALEYCRELIAFDSVSSRTNAPVSNYVQEQLQRLDFETERIEYTDPQGVPKVNVVGKKGSGNGGLAYFAHTDVVPAETWFTDKHGPFTPTVMEGKLYGRGSCDMKGSIACMLAAAERVSPGDLKQPLYVTCTADEEVGFAGAEQVAARSQLYREMVEGESHGVIGEPTVLEVVYAHKGSYGFVATSHGRAAHSSTRAGINANLAMIPFLVEMKSLYDETESDPRWQDPAFDPPTVSWNIGINDFNKAANITSPQSVCTVYFRPMPGQDADELLRRAREAAALHGLDFDVRWHKSAVHIDPNSEFVKEMLRLADRSTPRTVSYGTDGTMFTAMKHLVVFGPGDIAQAHTHDEWISLDQLEEGTRRFAALIQRWCG